ncbi:MAG: YqgE/AlgH family protein [Massilibacteroides sp.]|nr:YqgE/AlgH family protein [Massilibacteroides sp.]MDD3061749.1 YqgE/AlgH family protein [Massilibacteroides sp.]MDD4114692.1 YqgE/AlgH family protein [Massilibacteroides sp.]MDD4661349.1 YqgE/AlgH family protein [Massilibacteroides sp.]
MANQHNPFKIKHNNLPPSQGSLLISEPFLQDSYFQRAVVLLIQHNAEGSMGFVLNKKTDYVLNSFFPELKNVQDIPLYLGGPVSSNRLFFIHSLGESVVPQTMPINKDLCFDGDFEFLKNYILEGNPVEGKIKFFLGYSGWTKGQLGTEISSNSWLVSQETQNQPMLLAEGEAFWKSSLEVLGEKYQTWTRFPKDPHMN